MTPRRPIDRRRALQLVGAGGAAMLLAGCADNGDDFVPEDDPDDDVADDPDDTEEEPDDTEEEPDDTEEEPDDEDADAPANGFEIEPDTQIEFDGQTPGWVGIAPEEIEGEENPELVLEEGESYEIGWTEGDGASHNLEIRDENDEVVDDLQTDVVDDPDDDQWLEFEASDEMATYVCEPHAGTMVGNITVE